MATAYYANRISPNQIETPVEGYRICRNVPICRTGYQEYRGSELKKHPSYDPAWGLADDELYKVDRPVEEVTSPETIASFEGKSIVDEHPPEDIAPGSLISCETERELGCGHVQNVRVGDPLPKGIPLLADMHVKDDALIDKIDGGVRDISCGYTYLLGRREDKTLFQRNIRGNHVAVVPRGRAGPDVAIKDSAPDAVIESATPTETQTKQERKPIMDHLLHVIGLGSKALAATAEPEDFATAMRRVNIALTAARDADPDKKDDAKDKKAAKDADDDEKDKEIAELKATIAEMKKKMEPEKKAEADKKTAKDDAVDDLEDLQEDLEDIKEEIVAKSGDAVEEKSKAEDDDDSTVIDPDDDKAMGDGALKVKGAMDSARALVKAFRPLVAKGKASKAQVDAYNGAVRAINATKGTGTDAYAAFAGVKGPEMTEGAVKPAPVSVIDFFAGVSVAEGNKRLAEHNRQKAGK